MPIEQMVDGDGRCGKSESEVIPGAEIVRQGIHYCQEDDHTEGIPLVDTYLQGDWWS